jgi:hypothetical protein
MATLRFAQSQKKTGFFGSKKPSKESKAQQAHLERALMVFFLLFIPSLIFIFSY